MTFIENPECLADKDEFPACETGFFTWDIVANLLYGDGAVAEMFGLDSAETASGLPLEAYVARIHPEDQPAAAKIIHETILTQEPEQQSYRVRRANGTFHQVMAFGRCFRDKNGVPSLYGGIVFPFPRKRRWLHRCSTIAWRPTILPSGRQHGRRRPYSGGIDGYGLEKYGLYAPELTILVGSQKKRATASVALLVCISRRRERHRPRAPGSAGRYQAAARCRLPPRRP